MEVQATDGSLVTTDGAYSCMHGGGGEGVVGEGGREREREGGRETGTNEGKDQRTSIFLPRVHLTPPFIPHPLQIWRTQTKEIFNGGLGTLPTPATIV